MNERGSGPIGKIRVARQLKQGCRRVDFRGLKMHRCFLAVHEGCWFESGLLHTLDLLAEVFLLMGA